MDYLLVCSVALFASALTLVTGFGLGTLLMPAFAAFFPLPEAIAATAIVHLANNVFALGLVARHADKRVVLSFGIPAVVAAFAGAATLRALSDVRPLATWFIGSHLCEVTAVKLVIAALIVGFALLDLMPIGPRLRVGPRLLPLGGILSGYFGGLSGHQGTLRAAFLMRTGLSKEAYIGVNNVCSVMVDVARLLVYGLAFFDARSMPEGGIRGSFIGAACVAAFLGAFLGSRLMTKITLEVLRFGVAALLIITGIALGAGLL
ncbi:MAG: sulfite exporter TauE/SafE family protein [Phycisphaeraceae bacterium]|nr:sulfite exporter TauE/SafE family protein [Phycisphaeraceae bacterium]